MCIRDRGEYAETPEIVEALRQSGIDYAQGFSVGHPQLWSELAKATEASEAG